MSWLKVTLVNADKPFTLSRRYISAVVPMPVTSTTLIVSVGGERYEVEEDYETVCRMLGEEWTERDRQWWASLAGGPVK